MVIVLNLSCSPLMVFSTFDATAKTDSKVSPNTSTYTNVGNVIIIYSFHTDPFLIAQIFSILFVTVRYLHTPKMLKVFLGKA